MPSSPPQAVLGDWQLVHGHGPEGVVVVPEGHQVTLTVDAQGWSGSAGCNRYHGNIEVEGDRLTVRAVAVTAMMCPDPAVMAAEAAYLAAFSRVTAWSLTAETDVEAATETAGDLLVLNGPGAQLGFRASAAP